MIGTILAGNASPACITRRAGNTTHVSPPVCARPKWCSSTRSDPLPRVSVSRKVRSGIPFALFPSNGLSLAGPSPRTPLFSRINRWVFSCATNSTEAGNSTFPSTWSKCAWVLMIVVIGLDVSSPILSMSGCPQPASFVSTSTTPSLVKNAAELPPPPRRTYRLSSSRWVSTTI